MNIRFHVEIHFHEQNTASVFLESNSSGDPEKLGEVALMTFLAIRQMSNLGTNDTSDKLAGVLAHTPALIQGLATGRDTGGLRLIPYPGYEGRKRFLAQLQLSDHQSRFDLQAKGFGWFATGVGYYAPLSVFGLLRYLAMKRSEDEAYLASLCRSLEMTGHLHLSRHITLTNHAQIALAVLAQTCQQYLA